jgi:hypothetical protein
VWIEEEEEEEEEEVKEEKRMEAEGEESVFVQTAISTIYFQSFSNHSDFL